jgi:hypothetical protein
MLAALFRASKTIVFEHEVANNIIIAESYKSITISLWAGE